MKRRTGGTKRSSWLTFRRRLLIVRLLLQGPSSSDDLIATVQATLGDDGYPAAAAAALKHDLDALKGEYNCRIVFQREHARYVLEDPGELALLDISGELLEALAFLDASYPAGTAIPEQAALRALIDRVIQLLPAQQSYELQSRRSRSRSQLAMTGSGRIDPTVLLTVRRAIDEKKELAFKYWSTHDIGAPRRHRVAPYAITFRPEGYGYLDATLLEVTPGGNEPSLAVIDYRLDRIVPGTVQVLARPVPEPRPEPRPYQLRYWLHPNVARRRDVVAYFPSTDVAYYDDGSAIVSATVTNLWQARQILLRYGDSCRVLEPVELVTLFRETASGMASIYGIGD
ncbi:MAG TPA: WYL domain-containing protein [Roseiflexaceae bacterium]|nr:WYL domain-containing protein [Roseiflexaceae bacterium]